MAGGNDRQTLLLYSGWRTKPDGDARHNKIKKKPVPEDGAGFFVFGLRPSGKR